MSRGVADGRADSYGQEARDWSAVPVVRIGMRSREFPGCAVAVGRAKTVGTDSPLAVAVSRPIRVS